MGADADNRVRTSRRDCLLGGASAAAALAVPSMVRADTPVDLQLVLAVDASGSVDQRRFELQKQGYVQAFRNPRVLSAIHAGPQQAIAVTLFQWTGPRLQREVIPWMVVKDEETAQGVSAAIAEVPRRIFGGGTSISGAIDYGASLFPRSGYQGARRVIDVSGDGANNGGRPASRARDEAVAQGITINGLPILSVEPDLDDHYREEVIGGPGAFLIAAKDFDQFADAILKKLITEIAGLLPDGLMPG